MNIVILPKIEIGNFTIVSTRTIVTKSFLEGHCIIARSPSKKIKGLNKNQYIKFTKLFQYNEYIKSDKY